MNPVYVNSSQSLNSLCFYVVGMCNSKMLGQLAVLPRSCQLTGMLDITFFGGMKQCKPVIIFK